MVDRPEFSFFGRWDVAEQATTITNGATVEFGLTGGACRLLFDVSRVVIRPAIAVWVDGRGPVRMKLDVSGNVELPAARHVRFMANVDSGYLTNIDNWNSQQGAVVFQGVTGATPIRVPLSNNQIEFLGDSITAGLGVLKTETTNYDLSTQSPESNWPELVAHRLGMRPIVSGYGGQGITNPGTGEVPPAPEAFGFVYRGKPWNPTVKPALVVIYHGTNDRTITSAQYRSYLATIRLAYPQARIFAIVPHNRGDLVSPIQAACDAGVVFLDYSHGVIEKADTCDGTHLNPGGAVRLAVRLTEDIQALRQAQNLFQDRRDAIGHLLEADIREMYAID